MENFRKPNFELVADILFWLAKRYDPQAEIPDEIDEEKHRVEFIKSITVLFASKARIKLTPKKLYMADGYAVQELLKIATMLYKAYNATGHEDDDSATDFILPTKLSNLKALKAVAQEITDTGAKLHDLLEKEPELKTHRDKALQFLDNISTNLASNSEQAYIEKNIREIIKQQSENIVEMQKYVVNLEKDEKTLEEKIKRQSVELERGEKRLKSLTNVRPAFMDEYERLEQELERLYTKYVEKMRNLDYLEHQLDSYNQAEEEKAEESQKRLQKMRDRINQDEMRMLRGDDAVDEKLLEEQILREDSLGSRAQSRGGSKINNGTSKGSQGGFAGGSRKEMENGKKQQAQVYGNLNGPDDDDEDMGGEGSEGGEGSLIENLDDEEEEDGEEGEGGQGQGQSDDEDF